MIESTPSKGTGEVCLRPYQTNAVNTVGWLVKKGTKRVLIVAPTGAGKTTIAGDIITRIVNQGQKALFIAHRRELISQAYNRLINFGLPHKQVGVIMAKDSRRRPGAAVQVASIATLVNRIKPHADLVFIDEAHRALANSYKKITDYYPKAAHIGLTATPFRADDQGLGDMYDELVLVATPRKLIDEGFLVEPRVFTVPESKQPDLSAVKIQRGDYNEKALDKAVNKSSLVGNIVEHWQEYAQNLRTVAFAVSVAHSQHIAERFNDAGIAAEHLDGSTPIAQRDAILARLESGETKVVSNCGVLCEGWDQPAVKCAILARPTKSTGLYLQQAGRILRPWNGQRAIILDHAGCAIEHGLPQDDRNFSLDYTKEKKGDKKKPPIKVCKQCFAVLPAATQVCPECRFVFEKKNTLREKEGELTEVFAQNQNCRTKSMGSNNWRESIEEKRTEWDRLCQVAIRRSYKPGWVYYRYLETFGEKPPSYFPSIPYPSHRKGEEKSQFQNRIRIGKENA